MALHSWEYIYRKQSFTFYSNIWKVEEDRLLHKTVNSYVI